MSNLLILTNSSVKSCEGYSSKKPGKLRFTFPTLQSLKTNIKTENIDKAVEKLNTIYSELISAVEVTEKIKAEEEARKTMVGNAEIEAGIEQEKTVAKMTNVDEVEQKFKKLSIELLKLAGRVGTYKDKYGINVQKGFAQKPPKAISVKQVYTQIYSELMKKIDLYKFAAKENVELPQEQKPVPKSDEIPNWKKLFEGNVIQEKAPVVVNRAEEQEEVEVIQTVSGKVSEEDLDYRKMVGQLGDELELIHSYEKNPNSVPLQLKEGVKQRANKLRAILSNLTGIETKEMSEEEYNEVTNTEFQNIIDKVTGYVAPPTKEEHMKVEESLREYYSDDNVSTKIKELNEKDILYTFNKGMGQVFAAEARQNNETANLSMDKSNSIIEEINEKIEERNLAESINSEQVQEDAINTLNGYVEMNDKIEKEQANELIDMKKSAFIVARKLAARNTAIDLNEKYQIHNSAEEEARKLAAKNTAIDLNYLYQIASSADVEARKLAAKNTAIDLNELYQIAESSYEEARRLAARNTAIDLIDVDKIVKSSYTEALRLAAYNTAIDLNDLNYLADSSRMEAIRLAAMNTAIDLNELNQILESSYVEALRLAGRNTAIEFNEKDKIAKTASQFAVILASENVKQELLQKREQLNKELSSIDSSIEEINKKLNEYNNSIIPAEKVEKNSSIIVSPEEMKRCAEQEARRIIELDNIRQGAEQEAKRIVELDNIRASAEQEAGRIVELNNIRESAEQEAGRLLKLNRFRQGAEDQAIRLAELNNIRQGAEDEAKRIFDANRVEQTAIVQNVPSVPVINTQPIVTTQQATTPVVNNETMVQKVQQTTQTRDFSVLPVYNKYGEQTSNPRPIIANIARVDNIQKNGKAIMQESGILEESKNDNLSEINDLNEYLNGIMNQHDSNDTLEQVDEQGSTVQVEQDTIEKPLLDYDVA